MGAQKAKPKEREEPEKAVEVKKPAVDKEKVVKKWKGKEWYTVIAPDMFGGIEVGEIPATDPQSVVGRTVVVNLADITNNPSKYSMKVNLKVLNVDGTRAMTQFNGLHLVKENIFRIVRKRASKVEIVENVTTVDHWLLHIKIFAILNKVTDTQVERKVRASAMKFLKDFGSTSSLEDFVKTAADGLIQKNIKKFGSKIYPVRYCEIIKIEVKKAGK